MIMDWSMVVWPAIVVGGAAAVDVIVGLTPETWKPFGIPVGKYDGVVWKAVKKAILHRK